MSDDGLQNVSACAKLATDVVRKAKMDKIIKTLRMRVN